MKRRRDNKFTPAANGGGWCRPDKRLAIHLRDGLCCVYCGASTEEGASLQLDHYVRAQDGGSNCASNLVSACAFCNNSKNNDTIRQWYRRLRERGFDTDKIQRRARRLMAKNLRPFRDTAKRIITERKTEGVSLPLETCNSPRDIIKEAVSA
jgi:5-methylcytosine-specific restriction endonuclease McrA